VKISNSLGLPIDQIVASNPRVRSVANPFAAVNSVAWLSHFCIVNANFLTPFTVADLTLPSLSERPPLTRSFACGGPSLTQREQIAAALGCPVWAVVHDCPRVQAFANGDAVWGSDAWCAHQYLMAPPPLPRQQAVGLARAPPVPPHQPAVVAAGAPPPPTVYTGAGATPAGYFDLSSCAFR